MPTATAQLAPPAGPTPAWTPMRPHAVQRSLWTCSKRFVGVTAGRGSGKTELAKRRLVRFLPVQKPWPRPRYFYGAPTRDQAKRIAWDDLKALTPPSWVESISESNMIITTTYGSELHVVGLDKPQRLEGVQWDGGVLDESSDQKPGVFDRSVYPALTHRDAWCWRIGVPKRNGVGAKEYRKFCEDAAKGLVEDGAFFAWPSKDILSAAQLKWAMEHMDPKDFREQFEASWETAGGMVFHCFQREYNVRPCPYRPDKAIVVGSDFNVDPMCWVLAHAWPDRFEVFDELFVRNCNTQMALTILAKKYASHRGGFQFYGDATAGARRTSASKSDYQQILADESFVKLGRTIHYPKANPRRSDRFAATNMMLCNAAQDRRLFVDPRCEHLIEDLESRYRPPGENDPEDGGDLGHITDALGYPVYRLYPIMGAQDVGEVVIVGASQ